MRSSLARPFFSTSCVSAAKPTTSFGRFSWWPTVLRISGFSISCSAGGASPGCFLIFCSEEPATRQSATAATMTAISTGSLEITASRISSARSTWTVATPAGSAIVTGPETSVTSAPNSASAAAMAWPCLPEERLAM
ncbi:hypothetical protein D3C87_1470140 [compost metagenome]